MLWSSSYTLAKNARATTIFALLMLAQFMRDLERPGSTSRVVLLVMLRRGRRAAALEVHAELQFNALRGVALRCVSRTAQHEYHDDHWYIPCYGSCLTSSRRLMQVLFITSLISSKSSMISHNHQDHIMFLLFLHTFLLLLFVLFLFCFWF